MDDHIHEQLLRFKLGLQLTHLLFELHHLACWVDRLWELQAFVVNYQVERLASWSVVSADIRKLLCLALVRPIANLVNPLRKVVRLQHIP